MPRYFKWDYDHNEVIEYRRHGECNSCGQCCRTRIAYDAADRLTAGSGGRMGIGSTHKGVWAEVVVGKMRRAIGNVVVGIVGDERCPALTRANRCRVHKKKSLAFKGQAALCLAWPIIPEHVKPFDECSYSFEEIARWKIGDENDAIKKNDCG